MPGLIQGLEIARRALLAHQTAMNVTGHNIANVATEGFTRRRPVLATSVPESTPFGLIGTGVRLDDVIRTRSAFLDNQVRQEASLSGRWDARAQLLQQVEGIVGEPSETGIGALLDGFFNAWLELSNQPEDSGARSVVIQAAENLTFAVRDQESRFAELVESTDLQLEARVAATNGKLNEVARLNLAIQQAEIAGGTDGDLRDMRDRILDELATEAGATHLERADSSVVVRLGGRTVVEGTEVRPLRAERYTVQQRVKVRVLFDSDNGVPRDLGGELGGLIEVREEVLPGIRDQLDRVVRGLSERVNQIHRAGPSGADFFTGDSAATFAVHPEVAGDISLVNAGSSGDPGDNDIALALGGLRDERFLQRGTATVGDVYRQIITGIGSSTRQAASVSSAQRAAYDSVLSQRDSVIGVSLDEELTHLVETQKAYEAAARMITMASEMIDVLLAI